MNTTQPKFAIGDKVTLQNDYGVTFEGKTIVGIERNERGVCYFISPTDTPWFAFQERQLISEVQS